MQVLVPGHGREVDQLLRATYDNGLPTYLRTSVATNDEPHDVADRDVERGLVPRHQDAVRLRGIERDASDLVRCIRLRVQAVDRVMVQHLVGAVLAPPTGCALVVWIGKPDAACRIHDQIIGNIEPLAVQGIRQHSHAAVRLIADHAPRINGGAALAGAQPALPIEGQAVGAVGVFPINRAGSRAGVVAHDPALLNVREQQAGPVPYRSFAHAAIWRVE
jgi:hypothetical protein